MTCLDVCLIDSDVEFLERLGCLCSHPLSDGEVYSHDLLARSLPCPLSLRDSPSSCVRVQRTVSRRPSGSADFSPVPSAAQIGLHRTSVLADGLLSSRFSFWLLFNGISPVFTRH